jgi:hypothetical protein
MDEQIKKNFEVWWKKDPQYLPGDNLDKSAVYHRCLAAFEQGWAEGIASMFDKVNAKLSMMGRVRIPKAGIVVADEMTSEERIPRVLGIAGEILKKRKEVKGDGKTGKNKS